MAEYHVRLNKEGNIIAGVTNKAGKMTNSTVVTEEALAAVRDHLLIVTHNEDKNIGYAWSYPNGKTIIMKLEEKDSEVIKENKE